MLHWLPEDLWRRVGPSVAIQDDVNGFPRAAALGLLERGIHRIFTGINPDSGGAPFPPPIGLLVEDARRPPAVRLPGRGLLVGLRLLRAGRLAPRARCRGPAIPAIGRRGPAKSSPATRPPSARPTAACSSGSTPWKPAGIAIRCSC